MDNTCKDCKFYLPVDVFKGMCKMEKKPAGPDDLPCSSFERLSKCKFCTNYIPEQEFLGKCMGTTLAYPDMNASKCIDFKWSSQN
jgi:hypothetical protein